MTFSNTKEIRVLIYTINPIYKIFLAKMVFLCTIHFKLSIVSSLFVITVDSHHLVCSQEGKIHFICGFSSTPKKYISEQQYMVLVI